MESPFDEFSKSLAGSVPRRESLRLIAGGVVGAVFSLFGLRTAWGGKNDACHSFCRCSNAKKQKQCLAACRACNGSTGRLAGSCGSYVCCSTAACQGVCSDLNADPNCGACGNNCGDYGTTCCGNYCADLDNDFDNCGGCGAACDNPGPYEQGACVDGTCVYGCITGATTCNGICTDLGSDPNNCGACGNVCADGVCVQGACGDCPFGTLDCGGYCADVLFDANNCGACGHQCQPLEFCSWGACEGTGYEFGY